MPKDFQRKYRKPKKSSVSNKRKEPLSLQQGRGKKKLR